MNLFKCPNCNDSSREFDSFPSKVRYRWYEISQKRTLCRHCGAEVALESSFQKWGLLVLPAIVISVWDVALANRGGVNEALLYGCWGLAVLGLLMLYVKRKLVIVKPPSNNMPQTDAAKPRR